MTQSPVPRYLPPSPACHSGTGNRSRFTSSPDSVTSVTGARAGSSGTMLTGSGVTVSIRRSHSSIRSHTEMSAGRPSVTASRRRSLCALTRMRYPRGYPANSSNRTAGAPSVCCSISVMRPTSPSRLTPSSTRRSPRASIIASQSRRSSCGAPARTAPRSTGISELSFPVRTPGSSPAGGGRRAVMIVRLSPRRVDPLEPPLLHAADDHHVEHADQRGEEHQGEQVPGLETLPVEVEQVAHADVGHFHLADDHPDDAERGAEADPGEDVRHCAGQDHLAQQLPLGQAQHLAHLDVAAADEVGQML